MAEIDPIKLGIFAGNVVNGMPDTPSPEDVEVAKEAARLGLLDAMTDFDETTVPTEDTWGVPDQPALSPWWREARNDWLDDTLGDKP